MNLKCLWFAAALVFAALACWAEDPCPGQASEELPPACMDLMLRGNDAANSLDFDQAEQLTLQGVAMLPGHPLPRIFYQGVLLTRIQELVAAKAQDEALYQRFFKASDVAVSLSRKMGQEQPNSALSKLYLGGSLGTQGMGKLYRGDFIAAYTDGQAAAGELRQAVALDPHLYNAYLGLGQYEYYSGRLAGLFQMVLGMHGDVAEGIRLLKTCAQSATYAAIPARICLGRIFTQEVINYQEALPYVTDLYHRYPNNYAYVDYALREAEGLGSANPEARQLLDEVTRQWDQGWRPPAYAQMHLEERRLKLAESYSGKEVRR